ncbi:hypothetical protein ANTRET_LOCUS6859 [Anthophora retusa]
MKSRNIDLRESNFLIYVKSVKIAINFLFLCQSEVKQLSHLNYLNDETNDTGTYVHTYIPDLGKPTYHYMREKYKAK